MSFNVPNNVQYEYQFGSRFRNEFTAFLMLATNNGHRMDELSALDLLNHKSSDIFSGDIKAHFYITKANFNLAGIGRYCPIAGVQKIIHGKWAMVIIYYLSKGTLRFGELSKKIPQVTQANLTKELRTLEEFGLVHREVYREVPPKVEYSLTDIGLICSLVRQYKTEPYKNRLLVIC